MSLRKRSSSKPSSGRASNKMRLNNNGGIVEIESWVDFASNHDSDVEQLINPSQLNIKEESKESIYELSATKKRDNKMLENQSFEHQMLYEFKRFTDGMLSKMDEQNKLLSQLVLSQKSNCTSFSTFQSIKIKHDKCETKSNRDQCEVMEHSIEVPELFHDPYPFEKFEVNQLPHLEKESLKFYKEQLKFADKDKALAFYFFEHRNLSTGVKAGIKTAYNQFKLKYSIFSIDNLKNYFTNLDITNSMASSSLSLHWERMKRLAICSFGIKKQDFPKIKFSSNKQGSEENVSAINKDQYLKAANLLYAKGQYEDALLIHIMWSLASRPNEMLTLRFEDFEDKDGQKSVLYYANKKNQRKKFTISEELYAQVMNFKEMKVNNGTYQIR